MIRARELGGRAVVDIEAAEKLGSIDKVIVDPDARRVAGFVVTRGGPLFGHPSETFVPANTVHAVGPDAVTVRHARVEDTDTNAMAGLPRASDVIGRKVVSTNGRLLGVISDILIDERDGRIDGYELDDADAMARLGSLFSERKGAPAKVLRADVDLRTGRDLIVAPDDAVREGDAAPNSPAAAAPTTQPTRFPYSSTWFQRSGSDPDEDPQHPLR